MHDDAPAWTWKRLRSTKVWGTEERVDLDHCQRAGEPGDEQVRGVVASHLRDGYHRAGGHSYEREILEGLSPVISTASARLPL